MGLTHFHQPWVFLVSLLGLIIVFFLAYKISQKAPNYVPLVRTHRLTRLPSYKKSIRMTKINEAIIIGACLVLIFVQTAVAARPYDKVIFTKRIHSLVNHEVMLCTNKHINNYELDRVFSYFAPLTNVFSNSIGLTSMTTRVIPLSNQNWYTKKQLEFLGEFHTKEQQAKRQGTPPNIPRLLAEHRFRREIYYTDYSPNYLDTLALCLQGFSERNDVNKNDVRSILFIGSTVMTNNGEQKPIYSEPKITKLAAKKGVTINSINFSVNPSEEHSKVNTIVSATHGRFINTPVNIHKIEQMHQDVASINNTIDKSISEIYGKLHDSVPTQKVTEHRFIRDTPNTLLIISLFFTVILSIVLVRRRM